MARARWPETIASARSARFLVDTRLQAVLVLNLFVNVSRWLWHALLKAYRLLMGVHSPLSAHAPHAACSLSACRLSEGGECQSLSVRACQSVGWCRRHTRAGGNIFEVPCMRACAVCTLRVFMAFSCSSSCSVQPALVAPLQQATKSMQVHRATLGGQKFEENINNPLLPHLIQAAGGLPPDIRDIDQFACLRAVIVTGNEIFAT